MPTISKFLIVFLFLFQFSHGQNGSPKILKGKVIAETSDLEGIFIANLNLKNTAISENGGYFEILANVGDTLQFSAVQLKGENIKLKPEDFERGLFFVKIQVLIRQLDEVKIDEYKNINAVSLGILSKPAKSLTAAERKLYTASNSGSPVDALLNIFSGRTKMLKKEVEVEKKELAFEKLDYLFDEKYFIETLKIPADYLNGFKYYIVEDSELTKALKAKNKTMAKFIMTDLSVKYLSLINGK